jgi:hypothetical protein
MKYKWPFALIILGLLAFGGYSILPGPYKVFITSPKQTLNLITSIKSKDYCSCYFAQNLGSEYCGKWARKDLPDFLVDLEVNQEAKEIIASSVFNQKKARFLGPTDGCQLVQ